MRHPGVSSVEFAEFYAASKDRCLRAAVASGMRSEEAEDAVAEAFARAWASWPKVRKAESPAAWVVRTAVNTNISWWRKRRHETTTDATTEQSATEIDGSTELVDAMRLLPPRQREVVVLRYLLDLDTATTAQSLGIAPGTVAAHLHHAIAALREQLGQHEGMPS